MFYSSTFIAFELPPVVGNKAFPWGKFLGDY